jgi:signal transduction histidine kinase
MQLLPTLVTPHGEFDLPLSGHTAGKLVAAMLRGPGLPADCRCDETLLGETLAADPALALWGFVRAEQLEPGAILDLPQLTRWLAGVLLKELGPQSETAGEPPSMHRPRPAPRPAQIEAWGDLFGRSTGVAMLAAEIARDRKLDAQAAYLLGLLHLAADWLKISARRPAKSADAALPQWLQDRLAAVEAMSVEALSVETSAVAARATAPIGTVDDAVATASRLAVIKSGAGRSTPPFRFDRRAHKAQVDAARSEWLAPGDPEVLVQLVERLARLQKLETQFAWALEHEKLESLKELAYGAGHEINNPLANISARAQTLLQSESDPDRRRLLAAINTQAFRAHEMIADMMLFARPPKPQLAGVDLVALVGEVVGELSAQVAAVHGELNFTSPGAAIEITADKTQIGVAIRAVCSNALEARANGARVEIELRQPATSPETAQIIVRDNGPGIPAEMRQHIFDPFYSGREAGRGLGFGLSKCWRIVRMHGGTVEVGASETGGAEFTLSLPIRHEG